MHVIHAAEEVQHLEASSKLNAEWPYLTHLFEKGRAWASSWLDAHFDDLGERSTIDLDDLFSDTFKPIDSLEDVGCDSASPLPEPMPAPKATPAPKAASKPKSSRKPSASEDHNHQARYHQTFRELVECTKSGSWSWRWCC